MESPRIIDLTADDWQKITSGSIDGVISTLKTEGGVSLWLTYRLEGEASPEIGPNDVRFEGLPFNTRNYKIKTPHTADWYIYSKGGKSTIRVDLGIGGTTLIKQNSTLLTRPFSATGLPPIGSASDTDILVKPNASLIAPVDYYIEALPGECLAVARVMIHTLAATDIDSLEYGDQPELTNGIQVFYRRSGVVLDVTNGLPIKINEHWGQWCFDSVPVRVGATSKTPVWQSRWTLTKYGNPYGLVLSEGDRLGVRIRDDLSPLLRQTLIAEGLHLGVENEKWIKLL